MAYNEDSSVSVHDEPWIQWFCGLKGHEMFCEVERAYIEDGFNLYGLRACVPNFSDCLDLMLDRIGPDDSDDSHLTQSACTLYGLIHARYIITAHGLDAMYNKYAAKEFGTCPLVQCSGQPVLPVGVKDEVGVDTVKVFCPKCQCVYHPPPIRSRGGSCTVDGASFGTTFPHLFLMTFSNLVPDGLPLDSVYIPRVFGFRVHPSARQRNGSTGAGSSSTITNAATTTTSQQLSLKGRSSTNNTVVGSKGSGGYTPSSSQTHQQSQQQGDILAESTTTGITTIPPSQPATAAAAAAAVASKADGSNGNSCSKRKSKLSSGSERVISSEKGGSEGIGRGNADNGDGSVTVKTKNKRQRRPGNGVT